jgi:hypothetical protein
MDKNENIILLPCSCGCSLLRLERDTSENLYYLSHYLDSSYQEKSFFGLLKYKIKLIFAILSGKDYIFWDMVFGKESIKNFYLFLKEDFEE